MTRPAMTYTKPGALARLRVDAREKFGCPHCGVATGQSCQRDGCASVIVHDSRLDLALDHKIGSLLRYGYRLGHNTALNDARAALAAIEEVQP